MHGHLCIMGFRKTRYFRSIRDVEIACCRMCARLQDHCDGRVSSNRLLPARKKKEKHKADKNCLSSRPRPKAHTRGHPCRECWRQAGQAAGPTRSWSMPSTRGFPAHAHSRATPQTGRSGFRAASRDDVLPLIRPKLVCACLPFSPDHASLPREHAGGRDSATMSFWPSWVSTASKLGLRSPSRPGRV